MNYYELIYLKTELKNKLSNCVIEQAITPFKNLLELYMKGEEESSRLIFSCSSGNTALFIDTYRSAKKSNKLLFFESVYGIPVKDVILAENDRLLALEFVDNRKLWFKMFSNKANALLVKDGIIEEGFKDFDEVGKDEPKPKKIIFSVEGITGKTPKEILTISNPLFPRVEIEELIQANELVGKSMSEILTFSKEVSTQIENAPEFRRLKGGGTTLVSEDFLPTETNQFFNSVNDLIAYRFKNYAHNQRLSQLKSSFTKSISRQLKRLESVLGNLAKANKGVEKSKLYEKYGHLLMANAHLKNPESPKMNVKDLYEDENEITIDVNPKLTIAENAEHYYSRSSNSLASYSEAIKRIPELEKRKLRLNRMRLELSEIESLREIEDWKKKFKRELENLGLGTSKTRENSLPFHNLEIKGYKIWIGKNAKSNDKLVQLSHKEDVWMHARGVPGSHLIIRMANNKNMPPKDIIEEAASYAAFNSKAKGSNLVPVIFTKRKFVRKPKGSAPGAVLVQKEEVELVTPRKPTL